jgi:hypothetical protein
MNVIRHDDCCVEIKFLRMLVQAAFENDISRGRRKLPSTVGVESNEERMVVFSGDEEDDGDNHTSAAYYLGPSGRTTGSETRSHTSKSQT